MIPQHKPNKRIVFLTDCLGDLAGGAERQIYELAKGLNKNIYEVHIVSLDSWGQAPREIIEATGSHLHIFRVIRIYGLSGIIQGFRFYKFLKSNRIDILLTYHFSSDIWGTFWGHLAGVKTIISNRRDLGFWRNGLHVAVYRFINPWVNKIVTNSGPIKQMVVKEEGISPDRIDVIYNGVGLTEKMSSDTQELRSQLGLKSNDIVIMHVANIKLVKGHKYLLEAFAGITGQYPDLKLILIGFDELDGQFQDLAKTLNIFDKVLFLGKRKDVKTLLSLAEICVLPSLSEGMSNSILEYMAAAKPVIATNVGGNPELVINGFNGLLVDKENAEQLKDALLKLLQDKEKRQMMGQKGYLRAKAEFSMEAMIEKYTNLFKDTTRVLHLISSVGLFGAERVILNLAYKSKSITPFVGAFNNLHNSHLEIIKEAENLSLNTVVFDSRGKFDLKTINEIKKFITENKIDIVHTHNYKSDLFGACASALTHTKWIATHHGWVGTDQKVEFYEKLDSFILKHAQKVVLVSQKVKQKFSHLKQERLEVIDNGIPVEKFDLKNQNEPFRAALGIRPADCAIVIVGRLSKEKGHEIFLKAASEVIKNIRNVKFIIVGDGPLRDELKQLSHDLNLSEYVIFTGVREDMPAIYAACDIMVNASYTEGLPMTILEAMASHLPVIATEVGALGEVIKDQENGILLQPGDAQQLALKMIELAGDKEKRQRFAEKAYKKVCDRFSDTRMAQRYMEIYKEIASSLKSAPRNDT